MICGFLMRLAVYLGNWHFFDEAGTLTRELAVYLRNWRFDTLSDAWARKEAVFLFKTENLARRVSPLVLCKINDLIFFNQQLLFLFFVVSIGSTTAVFCTEWSDNGRLKGRFYFALNA